MNSTLSLHCRYFTPMRVRAKRKVRSRFLLERSPATSATKATSSSRQCTTFPLTVKHALSHCGICSSHHLRWSVGGATSNATRTTWTKKRTLLHPAKVSSPYHQKIDIDQSHWSYFKRSVCSISVNYDVSTAKNLLLLAVSQEEQQKWVGRLVKKIPKKPAPGEQFARSSPRSTMKVQASQSMRRPSRQLPTSKSR